MEMARNNFYARANAARALAHNPELLARAVVDLMVP
jgi:hypothetical protein